MSSVYFAYGSNLNLKDLRAYEKRNAVNEKKSFVDSINVLDGTFFLPDYQLQFPVYSGGREGGVLDVTPNVGHAVAGKLFEVDDWDLFSKIVREAFSHRRKTIRNALKTFMSPPLVDLLVENGLDLKLRPQQLSGEDYALIARCLASCAS